ncbi:hypothetical protein D3C74_408460 [compost metagenome]
MHYGRTQRRNTVLQVAFKTSQHIYPAFLVADQQINPAFAAFDKPILYDLYNGVSGFRLEQFDRDFVNVLAIFPLEYNLFVFDDFGDGNFTFRTILFIAQLNCLSRLPTG